MAKDDITTKYKIDISDFKKSITEANKQIKLANAEFKAASAGMDDWTKSTDGITAKLNQLDKVLNSQKQILESYKQQLQAQQSAYDENGKKAEQLKAKLQELADKGISKTSDEYKKYISALDDVEKEQQKNQTAIDKLNVQILNQEAAVKTTEKEIRNYDKSLAEVEKAEKDVADSGKDADKSIEDIGKTADNTDKKLDGLAKNIAAGITAGLAALAAAAVATGKEIVNLAADVAKAGDEIDKESQKLGMSAENYQKLSYAMEISGASIDELRKGTVNITKALGAFEEEGESAAKVEPFNKLNVSLVDAQGNLRTTDAVLLDTIDALAAMEDDVQRDIVANEIFGKTFTELRPMINGGSDAIKALMQEAEDYGMVMSDDAVASSAAFQDSLTKMQGTLEGVKNRLGAELLPSITQVMDGISDFVAGVDGGAEKVEQGIDDLISGIKKALPQVGKFIDGLKNAFAKQIPGIIKSLAKELVKALPEAAKMLTEIAEYLADMLLDMLPMLLDTSIQIVNQILISLSDVLPKIIDKIISIVPEIVKMLAEATPQLIQGAISFLMGIVQALPFIIESLNEAAPEIVQALSDALIQSIPILIDGGIMLFTALIQLIPEMIPQAAKAIINMIGSLAKVLIDCAPVLLDSAKKLFMSLIDGLKNIFPIFKQTVDNLLDMFINEFGLDEAMREKWESFCEGAAQAWETIKSIFGVVADWFGDTFSEAWENVKKVFSAGGEIFAGIQDGIYETFKTVVNALLEGINILIAQPFEQINEVLNSIRNIDILGLKPFEGLWAENPLAIPAIPMLARGGILKRGQVGILEGNGAEAVIPLENNKEWIRAVAKEMQTATAAANITNNNNKAYNFVQNNYSPKALSRLDIYRQTKNLTAMLKGAAV